MQIKTLFGFVACALALSACDAESMRKFNESLAGNPPPAPAPKISTEVVNMNMQTQLHLGRLQTVLMQDPPARAELNCSLANPVCTEARSMLERRGIPVQVNDSTDVVLIYQRPTIAPDPVAALPVPSDALAPAAGGALPVAAEPAKDTNALPAPPAVLWQPAAR